MKRYSAQDEADDERKTQIIDDDGYYIDKTDVIPWILDRKKLVTLFTRPRRFGKATMMSMIKAFFEYRIDRSNIESNIEYGSGRLDLAVWRKDRVYLLKLKNISLSELRACLVSFYNNPYKRHGYQLQSVMSQSFTIFPKASAFIQPSK